MGRGRKHILDEMTSYFPNAKPPLSSTGDYRALHMAERYPFTNSPSPKYGQRKPYLRQVN